MTEIAFPLLILVAAFVGAAAGFLGSFMVLKRMALVGDALSHVALPGMAIAITLGINPILGAFTALILAVIGIWYFQQHSSVYPEALVGIFFTASLAIGILVTPEPELLEALFGNIESINMVEGIAAIVISALLLIFSHLLSKKLILGVISEELSKSVNISSSRTNLFYYILVGTVVALGVRFVGTLLMGALVIVPAASAKNISRNLPGYYAWTVIFGILSSVIGIVVANSLSLSPGPIVVLTSIFFFLVSFFFKSAAR